MSEFLDWAFRQHALHAAGEESVFADWPSALVTRYADKPSEIVLVPASIAEEWHSHSLEDKGEVQSAEDAAAKGRKR